MKELKDYVAKWKSIEGIKPKNEPEFINGFLELLQTLEDDRDISFDGEGSYFGKQVTLSYGAGVWVRDRELSFEICYSRDTISVYRADHDGFWVPEYLYLKSGKDKEYITVSNILFPLLKRVFGVD